ncbi:MAG: flavin reductase [Gracilibacteraceae bacterium]|jgi:flavin reductase (DIM6/NTAB) family NADH-FMN oxidoreductase RutF/rubredoxin|nr:flavin reductase [Gracilibacteraceae bacterium]
MVWICNVCGYRHEGPNPPDNCPLCGVAATEFQLESGEAPASGAVASEAAFAASAGAADRLKAVAALSYGLYVITARATLDGRTIDNGQTANTCFQITAEPLRLALGINKKNYTHELIKQSGAAGITVLHEGNIDLVRNFGYSSGRERDKFAGLTTRRSAAGILYPAGGLAAIETRVLSSLDAGTHTLFLCEVTEAWYDGGGAPMTYAWFSAHKRD